MSLKVAVQMDHISSINIKGDSTFAMLLEASRRGHQLYHYTPEQLAYRDGMISAPLQSLGVKDVDGDHFDLGVAEPTDLATLNVILLRQDPPFDLAYITTTHLLEMVHPKTLVVNDPAAVRNAPEKVLVLDFREFMPPTLITRSLDDVKAFRAEFDDIIVKPLHGHGGRNVFRLQPGDENLAALVALFNSLYREPFMVQTYLPDVRQGDKRILLVDGEPVGGVNRVPASDDTRSNMVQGGRAEATELTEREREICAALGPVLKERGLLFVGIDVIGGLLTEINVTSPTGIRSVEALSGIPVSALLWEVIERRGD